MAALQPKLASLLQKLKRKDAYGFFLDPVNPADVRSLRQPRWRRPYRAVRAPFTTAASRRAAAALAAGLQVPDYATVIKTPMDFSTMQKRVDAGAYGSVDALAADFRLICRNAMTYNAPETIYYKEAEKLLEEGEKLIAGAVSRLACECHRPSACGRGHRCLVAPLGNLVRVTSTTRHHFSCVMRVQRRRQQRRSARRPARLVPATPAKPARPSKRRRAQVPHRRAWTWTRTLQAPARRLTRRCLLQLPAAAG